MKKKTCAVCGDKCQTNVRLRWKRDKDGNCYSVCCRCAEEKGKVNANSVENFKAGYLGKNIDNNYKHETTAKKVAFTKGYTKDYLKRVM